MRLRLSIYLGLLPTLFFSLLIVIFCGVGTTDIGPYSYDPFFLEGYLHLFPGNSRPDDRFMCQYETYYTPYGHEYFHCIVRLDDNPYFASLSVFGNANYITSVSMQVRESMVRMGHIVTHTGRANPARRQTYRRSVLHSWRWGNGDISAHTSLAIGPSIYYFSPVVFIRFNNSSFNVIFDDESR